MKITVIGPTYPYKGGISHYNTLLCENLAKKHEVTNISFKRLYPKILFPGKTQIDFLSKIKPENFNSYQLIDSINPFTWFKTFRFIKNYKPDLLILQWWTPFWALVFSTISFLVKYFTNTKILFLCHNVLPHEKTILDKFLTKLTLKNSDYFIVHSNNSKTELENLIQNPNIKVGFHPTYDVFNYKHKAKIKKLKKENIMLFFGYVRKYKGLMNLIDIMPNILKEIKVKLLIVGEFWKDKQDYINKINKLKLNNDVIIIDKYISDEEVGDYFQLADIVVLPYLFSTNSGIIQIAFGFQKPVITTNVGGLKEVVTDGKTGYVVQSKDNKALTQKIIDFYKLKMKSKFIKNIKKEQKKYSWDNMIKLIEDFIK